MDTEGGTTAHNNRFLFAGILHKIWMDAIGVFLKCISVKKQIRIFSTTVVA